MIDWRSVEKVFAELHTRVGDDSTFLVRVEDLQNVVLHSDRQFAQLEGRVDLCDELLTVDSFGAIVERKLRLE